MGKYHIYRKNLKFILPIVLLATVTGGTIELAIITHKSDKNNHSENVNENSINYKGKSPNNLKPLNLYEKEAEEDVDENFVAKKPIDNYKPSSSNQNRNVLSDELIDPPPCPFSNE